MSSKKCSIGGVDLVFGFWFLFRFDEELSLIDIIEVDNEGDSVKAAFLIL